MSDNVKLIQQVLEVAKESECKEVEVRLPTANRNGLGKFEHLHIKAKW